MFAKAAETGTVKLGSIGTCAVGVGDGASPLPPHPPTVKVKAIPSMQKRLLRMNLRPSSPDSKNDLTH